MIRRKNDKFTFLDVVPSEDSVPKSARIRSTNVFDELTSNISPRNNSNRSELLLKNYVKMSFDDYLVKISKPYYGYKKNHTKTQSNQPHQIEEDIAFVYNSNAPKVLKRISPYYKVDASKFKLDEKNLGSSIEKIQDIIRGLIEDSGNLELETEKIISKNKSFYNYLNLIFPPIDEKVNLLNSKIATWKNMIFTIKKKYIETNSKLLIKKVKKDNLRKMKEIFQKLLFIRTIANNKDYDKIPQGQEALKTLPELKILSEISKDFAYIVSNSNDQLLKEIEVLLKEKVGGIFCIKKNEPTERLKGEYYKFDNDIFDQIVDLQSQSQSKDNVALLYNEVDLTEVVSKINHLSEASIPQENVAELEKKILALCNDCYISSIKSIIQLKVSNDMLFVFYSYKIFEKLVRLIEEEIVLRIKNYKSFFSENFLTTFKAKLLSTFTSNIQFVFTLTQQIQLDEFMARQYYLKKILTSNKELTKGKNFNNEITALEPEFLRKYKQIKENKISEGISFDPFTPLELIPSNYQIYVDKILSFNISDIDSYQKGTEFFSYNTNDLKSVGLISIPPKNYKLMLSSLDVITITFESLKMLSCFAFSSENIILTTLYDCYKMFLNLNNKIVLESNGHIESVSQNEISMCYQNAEFIENMTAKMHENNKTLNNFTKGLFSKLQNELIEVISSIKALSKSKMNEILKLACIQVSIDEFSKMNFNDYHVCNEGNTKINSFSLSLVRMINAVHGSMNGVFEAEFINKLFEDNLNYFISQIEVILENVIEIEGEDGKKQFKKDFLFLKKNINIPGLELKNFKKKIAQIYKRYVPQEKLKTAR